MTKEWVELQTQRYEEHIQNKIKKIKDAITGQALIPDAYKIRYIELLDTMASSDDYHRIGIDFEMLMYCIEEHDDQTHEQFHKWFEDNILPDFQSVRNYYEYYVHGHREFSTKDRFTRYQDSEPIHFEGTVIITDPCYIMKESETEKDYDSQPKPEDYETFSDPRQYPDYDKKTHQSATWNKEVDAFCEATRIWQEENADDWERSDCGSHLDVLGLKTWMTRDTIYGDWSCSTYNTNTKKKIGDFCADAGLVSVMLLEEILQYNPEFDYHDEKSWTTTKIENFKGDIQFIVVRLQGDIDDEVTDSWDFEVQVHGHGINTKTGDRIDFMTTQTGL